MMIDHLNIFGRQKRRMPQSDTCDIISSVKKDDVEPFVLFRGIRR
jgi:hypothetical protein